MTSDSRGPAEDPRGEKAGEQLQGSVPSLATPDEVRAAVERAFDYRGDVTVTLKSGERIEGFIFDRRAEGASLEHCLFRLIPRDRNDRVVIRYCDLARLEFSGRDTAEGKSYEAWLRKFSERKARGETNISLEPEALD